MFRREAPYLRGKLHPGRAYAHRPPPPNPSHGAMAPNGRDIIALWRRPQARWRRMQTTSTQTNAIQFEGPGEQTCQVGRAEKRRAKTGAKPSPRSRPNGGTPRYTGPRAGRSTIIDFLDREPTLKAERRGRAAGTRHLLTSRDTRPPPNIQKSETNSYKFHIAKRKQKRETDSIGGATPKRHHTQLPQTIIFVNKNHKRTHKKETKIKKNVNI